jgi:isopentenyl diphosphate isomerase/L-lactate dehydrogenase-like FMN-dependent dehydrogenase
MKEIKTKRIKKTNKTKKITKLIKPSKITHFPIDVSKDFLTKLVNSDNLSENLYNKKLTFKKPSSDEEINVTWDFMKLRQGILDTISKRIYGWYHENTSSCGNSTFDAIDAYSKIKIIPNYLNPDKNVSFNKNITLHSNEYGVSKFVSKCPFFTAPYGCASEYGGKSNEVSTMIGTIKADGIYTLAHLTEYNLEYLVNILKENSNEPNPFYMFQLYLTGDNDINISLIERAKMCGVSVIMITIDTGSNNHGGVGLLENQSDLTFQRNFCGNLFYDPVFNIKCYNEKKCVGTKDKSVLSVVSEYLSVPIDTLVSSYNFTDSFDYAKTVQGHGMGAVNVTNENSKHYDLSIKNVASICHSSKSLCKYVKRKITTGMPMVIKGCVSVENALEVQKANADGIYVSNHGGRFIYNSVPPLNIVNDIRNAVKKVNKDFGVWLDGGIRNGQDILTAYTQGAEFVGVGRPIIYACVLYGEPGVSSITKKLRFELEGQCKLCGQNDLNDYNKLRKNVNNKYIE